MACIGSKLSLISTSDVRYVGTLWAIDPKDSTIALKNVKCMGTEDRSQENTIEPSSKIYEFIIFKGENIKHIKLIEEEPRNVLDDPAVLEVKKDSSWCPSNQQENKKGQKLKSMISDGDEGIWGAGAVREKRACSRGGGRPGRGRGQWHDNNMGYQQSTRNHYNRNLESSNQRGDGDMGGYSNSRKLPNGSESGVPGTGEYLEQHIKEIDDVDVDVTNEFDFEGNLARFDMRRLKEVIHEEVSNKDEQDPKEPTTENIKKETGSEGKEKEVSSSQETGAVYNKDDFFDSLSTDRDDRRRPTESEASQLNAETFGKVGSTHRCRTRWFRRWGGNFRNRGSSRGRNNQHNQ